VNSGESQATTRCCSPEPAGRPVAVAVLTPAGRGAIAVVGVAGAGAARMVDSLFVPREGKPVADRADGSICVGRWGGGAGEELVVVRHAADRLEVHCHGGNAASAAVIESLAAGGTRTLCGQEWQSLAASSPCRGGTGEIAGEAREALARAGGPKAARILARQLAGALDRELVRIEALRVAGDGPAARAAADRLLRSSRVGLRLDRPWRVVLAGPANAGKSSLVNALAGHARSLVSPVAGTTRDLVETRIVLDGWEIDLVDTAGLRAAATGSVEAAGIARAMSAQADADLVLRVTAADQPAVAMSQPVPGEVAVVSKCDLADADAPASRPALLTSAMTGSGIDALASRIVAALVPEEHDDPDLLAGPVPFTERQVGLISRLRPSTPSTCPAGEA
jgi:tRNA modification GTPase